METIDKPIPTSIPPPKPRKSKMRFVMISFFVILIGVLGAYVWNIYRSYQGSLSDQTQFEKRVDKIRHWDEMLATTAKIIVVRGDEEWHERYREIKSSRDIAILRVMKMAPEIFQSDEATSMEKAKLKLMKLEGQAIDHALRDRMDLAGALFFGDPYKESKQEYVSRIQKLIEETEVALRSTLESNQKRFFWSLIGTIIGLFFVVLSGVVLSMIIKSRPRK